VIERFYKALRNVWRAKPPIPKPSYLPNLHMGAALYTQKQGLSNLFILKTPHKNAQKL
jgi:hypothetical protein